MMTDQANVIREKRSICKRYKLTCFFLLISILTMGKAILVGNPETVTNIKQSTFDFSLWLLLGLLSTCATWWLFLINKEGNKQSESKNWWLINAVLPLLFVFTPPIFYGLFLNTGPKPYCVTEIYFPIYFSLWIVLATVFLIVLTEVLGNIALQDTDSFKTSIDWKRRNWAAISIVIASACLLFFALPYVTEFTFDHGPGAPEHYPLLVTAIIATMMGLPYASKMIHALSSISISSQEDMPRLPEIH